MKFKVKRLSPTAQLPNRAHATDSGWDVFCNKVERDRTYGVVTVFTGLAVQPEEGYYIEVVPRSSVYKKQMHLANSVGIIDQSYRGEIILRFFERNYPDDIKVGEKIAQLIVRKRIDIEWEEVQDLNETARGSDGFGSTGK